MTPTYNIDNIVAKDVHCPFCGADDAVLINKTVSRKNSIQLPAYGLKFVLSLIYLAFIHIWINGFKLIEVIKTVDNMTYYADKKYAPGHIDDAVAITVHNPDTANIFIGIEH